MDSFVHPIRKVETVRVAVVYASHYGATRGIAERIAAELGVAGLSVRVYDAAEPPHAEDMAGVDAFVIGSAVYMGHWLRDATGFVRRYQPTLIEHPVWLFSSGPLGTPATEAEATDILTDTVPAEIADFGTTVHPLDHRVFFGAIDPDSLSLAHRTIRRFPGAAEKIPAGDFRDWPQIEAWAREIARTLVMPAR